MRTLLVDDHVLFRQGLASLLDIQPDFSVIGEASSVDEAIKMAGELQPDLVLMDFGLPDSTGLDATQAILADRPETNIVFLTMHEEDDRLFAAIRSGAKGYLLKNVPITRLLEFLRGIEHGHAAISRSMASRVFDEFARIGPGGNNGQQYPLDELTLREIEVLQQLATGASNRQIADHLVIAENTVKNHVSNILTKLHLENRREAAKFARNHQLPSAQV